ncbi:YkyB family protein [Aquibacillus koreensis]|uniref:YkyB family protein n=1 Tax=Aquibacillus koreensis TaxID=279446 RepID=A0A9X4AGP2_9BACI|nr:YkyB family protein [Aquibacillus koreensis]MCT2534985.1 YkyB family protein [Aquibacillus koreensis]MDC3419272.1 YkyB family protein [Aquibacillus koreensis]
MRELPHFHNWHNVPSGFYTKTTLRNDFKRKPLDEAKPDATLKAIGGGIWRDFVLYHINHTIPIKPRQVDISTLDFSVHYLSQALYRINKHAKKHRDTKQQSYLDSNYQVVSAAKTKQLKYYELKNVVLDKLLEEKKATVIGYHKMFNYYYLLITCGEYSFHKPIHKKNIDNYNDLGVLDQIIAAEHDKQLDINFYQAEKLLRCYISVTTTQIPHLDSKKDNSV